MWMGNRGILHDDNRRIVSQWRLRRWITCTLSFKGRRRKVFTPHRYSELFFLDEATAFAAGHRPCAECRRPRFNEFREAWLAANLHTVTDRYVRVEEIDRVLHAERTLQGGGKKTYGARVHELPPGTMIEYRNAPHLLWDGGLWPWGFRSYADAFEARDGGEEVAVLTPASLVRMFAAGFRPQVHESAHGRTERSDR
jgi:hypothetical protein